MNNSAPNVEQKTAVQKLPSKAGVPAQDADLVPESGQGVAHLLERALGHVAPGG